jgi:plastocyanin
VKAGTTVTWLNAYAPHAVASSSNLFKSKAFTDGSFSFTFTTPGVYELC